MTIYKISADLPSCYGICCQRRKECQRYARIEQTSTDHTIATCDNGLGDKPLFIALELPARQP